MLYFVFVSSDLVTLPGLSSGLSASMDRPEVPAAGSVGPLVVPGVISVLSVPTSLTQNCNVHRRGPVCENESDFRPLMQSQDA